MALNVTWEPEPIISLKNRCFFRKSKELNAAFWDEWGSDKSRLKTRGYFVVRDGSRWKLLQRLSPEEYYASKAIAKKVKLKNKKGLLKFQVPHTERLLNALQKTNFAVDGSITGAGKSYAAAAVARELGRAVIVVCPKSAITMWRRVLRVMGTECIDVANYERLRLCREIYLGKGAKEKPDWRLDKDSVMIVFDEAHKVKNRTTQNTQLLVSAVDQGYRGLLLSATVADNPLNFYGLGYALGLFRPISKHYVWAQLFGAELGEYGVGRGGHKPLVYYGGTGNLKRLHEVVFDQGRGARMISKDIPNYPVDRIIAETYDLDSVSLKKIQKLYDDLNPSCSLADLQSLRQAVEVAKISLVVEMAENLIAEGNSVVIFTNYNESRERIAEALADHVVVQIHGRQTARARQDAIDAFQNDEARVVVANIRAGGIAVSLHDLNGKYPRASILNPTWSAQDFRQALGRICRVGQKSPSCQYVMYAADTIEELICEKLRAKLNRIDALNDGDFDELNCTLTRGQIGVDDHG